MKLLLFFSAVLVGVAAIAGSAEAIDYPWCAEYADGAGVNCGFTTYEQCMETARGSGGYCALNNTYSPPVAAARSRHPPRKQRSNNSNKN